MTAERMDGRGGPVRGTSLIRRAVLGVVLMELACLVALATLSILHERETRLRATDVMLAGRTDSVFGGVQDAEDANDTVRLDSRELKVPATDYFAVYDAAGRELAASESAPRRLLRLRATTRAEFSTERAGRSSYRVLQRGYLRIVDRGESETSGIARPITIVYATQLDGLWRAIFKAIGYYLATSVVLTVVTTVLLVSLMRRVLRPIEALAAAAAAVSPRDLRFRAPAEALEARELRPLALTLDTMISELREMFDRQHRFLGDAAHELKTAVAVVRSSLQLLLLKPRSTAAYEEGVMVTLEDTARAERLISRMLLMARLEEIHVPSLAQADLRLALRACVGQLWPLAERAEVRVEVYWPEATEGLEVRGRHLDGAGGEDGILVPVALQDLETLISTLLLNAIEHSPPKSRITLRVTTAADGARLTVTDQGEGIPADALQHIFERFFRADASRTRDTGGAGLGLSIAKAIAEGAGGTIAVASEQGVGTAMTVCLPFASSDEGSRDLVNFDGDGR